MRIKKLTLFPMLFVIAIALTACGGTSANAAIEGAPGTNEPAIQTSPLASNTAPAPASTNTSAPQATAAQTSSVSFAKDVMPIFESRCIKCHGGESTKEGLDLKTYTSLMSGSKNGSVLAPGNANDSFLVHQLLDGEMPKRGPKLTPDQVQTIVNWVNAGALDN